MRVYRCGVCGTQGHNERTHQRKISNPPPQDIPSRKTSTGGEGANNAIPVAASTIDYDAMLARTREATQSPPRMEVGDTIVAHTDADGQPVTFSYKVTERKPATVTVRMIRFDGSLGEEKKYRVQRSDYGSEYVKLSPYLWAQLSN